LLVLFTAQGTAQSGKKLTVSGKLTRVMAIGGDRRAGRFSLWKKPRLLDRRYIQ
jgi:hypothetical protein